MKKYYFNVNQYNFLTDKFPEILKKFSGKTLIISLIQEDRTLEKKLKISDEIIYDNSDYINNTVKFNKAVMEINDNLDILPSSYKMKEKSVDFNRIIEELDNEDYKNLIVFFDDKLEIKNKPELTKQEEIKELLECIEILNNENQSENSTNYNDEIIGNNSKDKVSIFEKIKRLFKRNG